MQYVWFWRIEFDWSQDGELMYQAIQGYHDQKDEEEDSWENSLDSDDSYNSEDWEKDCDEEEKQAARNRKAARKEEKRILTEEKEKLDAIIDDGTPEETDQVIRALIRRGAYVIPGIMSQTISKYTLSLHHYSLLLEYGGDPNEQHSSSDDNILFPLIEAIVKERDELVLLLLEYRADPSIVPVNRRGRKLIVSRIALGWDLQTDTMIALIEKIPRTQYPLAFAAALHHKRHEVAQYIRSTFIEGIPCGVLSQTIAQRYDPINLRRLFEEEVEWNFSSPPCKLRLHYLLLSR